MGQHCVTLVALLLLKFAGEENSRRPAIRMPRKALAVSIETGIPRVCMRQQCGASVAFLQRFNV
jgi:hypothetical protein